VILCDGVAGKQEGRKERTQGRRSLDLSITMESVPSLWA
jgi:hypothetical protein